MNFRPSRLLVGLVISLLPTVAPGQERKLQERDVPKPVIDAFKTAFPNAKIKGFSQETENNVTTYEVESVEGTTHRDASYLADGTVVVVEQSLPAKDLPQAVRDSLAAHYPTYAIAICERVVKGTTTQYELLVRSGKRAFELVYDPNGTLVKTEVK